MNSKIASRASSLVAKRRWYTSSVFTVAKKLSDTALSQRRHARCRVRMPLPASAGQTEAVSVERFNLHASVYEAASL